MMKNITITVFPFFITEPVFIDQVIIISAVKEPELSFQQLNRYIAFAKYHNLNAVLCFNKNDLSNDDKTIEKVFKIYEPLGFDILFTSALEGYGIEEFKAVLKNKTSVLCGASGVGKSINFNCATIKDSFSYMVIPSLIASSFVSNHS